MQTQWLALLAAARARGELSPELDERFAWEVLLGRDRSVNAFALPGGYLGVHLGLIGVVVSRDELASVLAHELSHVTQRHIARLMAQQSRQTPLMIGAMILGALAASKSPDAAQALAIGGQALVVQNQLNFSRDMEREADRVGYSLMAPAGFAPQGFVGMFDKLQQANRLNDNGSWPYLRSHPLTTQRIADMQSRLPPGASTLAPAPALEHAMVSARARGAVAARGGRAAPVAGRAAQHGVCRTARSAARGRVVCRRAGRQPTALTTRAPVPCWRRCRPWCRATPRRSARCGCWPPSWLWPQAMRRPPARPCLLGRCCQLPDRPRCCCAAQVLLRAGPGAGVAGPLQTLVGYAPARRRCLATAGQVWQPKARCCAACAPKPRPTLRTTTTPPPWTAASRAGVARKGSAPGRFCRSLHHRHAPARRR